MNQRIVVISTNARVPVMMRAVYKDGNLVVDERKVLPSNKPQMLAELMVVIPKMARAGFKILVDEISGEISKAIGGTKTRLSDRCHDGSPIIVTAVERYEELGRQSCLILPPKEKSLYEISKSIIDVEYNTSGEPVYRIDWDSLRPEHSLILLAVYATTFNNVATSAYIQAMQGRNDTANNSSIFSSLASIIDHHQTSGVNSASKSSLTGTRLNKNTVIL